METENTSHVRDVLGDNLWILVATTAGIRSFTTYEKFAVAGASTKKSLDGRASATRAR
jgi:hypothetical protein